MALVWGTLGYAPIERKLSIMKKRIYAPIAAVTLLFAFVGVAATVQTARSVKVKDILKGGAIVLAADALSKPLNDAVNKITLNQGVPIHASTKVVPVIAFGSGTRAGFVQVSGPKNLVSKTKVVVQIESKITIKNLDVEVFVPSDSVNPLKFNRVEGVGITALVDYRL